MKNGRKNIKPESYHIQGICVSCGINKQTQARRDKYRNIVYRPYCQSCVKKMQRKKNVYKKSVMCEHCGFVALHPCQLDLDHIDGNNKNNNPSNLRTLCANCHRLKTFKNKDFMNKYLDSIFQTPITSNSKMKSCSGQMKLWTIIP